jgi:hypothetical protein
MYRAEFTDNEDLVMTLEIESENRCEMLNVILKDDYMQSGHFVIEEYDTDDIIFHLLIIEMNQDSDIDLDDTEYQEYLYRAKFHSEYGLTLRPFLAENNYEINTIDIFNLFCESIKLKFEYDNDSLNIDYKTERV